MADNDHLPDSCEECGAYVEGGDMLCYHCLARAREEDHAIEVYLERRREPKQYD